MASEINHCALCSQPKRFAFVQLTAARGLCVECMLLAHNTAIALGLVQVTIALATFNKGVTPRES